METNSPSKNVAVSRWWGPIHNEVDQAVLELWGELTPSDILATAKIFLEPQPPRAVRHHDRRDEAV